MKQLVQSKRGGRLQVLEVPVPEPAPGFVLVRVEASAVSPGTERMATELASQGMLKKALARPGLLQEAIGRVRTQGLANTMEAVRAKVDGVTSLGYSNAGVVIAVGPHVLDVRVGDRVACAGAGYAMHAEVVAVPRNLVAGIPDSVTAEDAAFATIGAIALHGLRLAEPRLGETVAVIGLGLIGLLTVQLARAAGCRVLGMDPNPQRCARAKELGADAASSDEERFCSLAASHTAGQGADAVIITAASTSDAPVRLAAQVARSRARVIAVGSVANHLPRTPYFLKELEYCISRSYGPGRYDPAYEEGGQDYPADYVRWTENRNMQAFLDLLGSGSVRMRPLITHRVPVEDAERIFDLITGQGGEAPLGMVITYTLRPSLKPRVALHGPARTAVAAEARAGVLGAGAFATATLLPAMRAAGVEFVGIASGSGLSARQAAQRFGFRFCAAGEEQVIADPDVNTVVVLTRHHLHARQVLGALQAGKHVFCEKPLCVNEEELAAIAEAYARAHQDGSGPQLMVGFNRRFAPMVRQMKEFLEQGQGARMMHYRVNAGSVPRQSWLHDHAQGGGRIIGEVCHFIDLLCFLAGEAPLRVGGRLLPNQGIFSNDNLLVVLEFPGGTVGAVTYVANGDPGFAKERIEVFGGGVAVLDDFRCLELVRGGRRRVVRDRWGQDKGHLAEWRVFVEGMRSGRPAMRFSDIVASMQATFCAARAARGGEAVAVDLARFDRSLGEPHEHV